MRQAPSVTPRSGHERCPRADHVVDALIAARLVDPSARQDSIGVVAGVLGARDVTWGTGEPTATQPAAAGRGRRLPRRRARARGRRALPGRSSGVISASARGSRCSPWSPLSCSSRGSSPRGFRPARRAARPTPKTYAAGWPGALLTGAALGCRLPGRPRARRARGLRPSPGSTGRPWPVPSSVCWSRRSATGSLRPPSGWSEPSAGAVDGDDDRRSRLSTGTRGTRSASSLFLLGAVWLGLTEMRLLPRVDRGAVARCDGRPRGRPGAGAGRDPLLARLPADAWPVRGASAG